MHLGLLAQVPADSSGIAWRMRRGIMHWGGVRGIGISMSIGIGTGKLGILIRITT